MLVSSGVPILCRLAQSRENSSSPGIPRASSAGSDRESWRCRFATWAGLARAADAGLSRCRFAWHPRCAQSYHARPPQGKTSSRSGARRRHCTAGCVRPSATRMCALAWCRHGSSRTLSWRPRSGGFSMKPSRFTVCARCGAGGRAPPG